MTKHRRRSPLTAGSRSLSTARKAVAVRKLFAAERLESRSMMAGDLFVSDYWNNMKPTDVNGDGNVTPFDALAVINELNQRGARSLGIRPATVSAGGEGESSPDDFFFDVNNDGMVTPFDALAVINTLNAEGEDGDDLMAFTIHAYSPDTDTPITTLARGEEFDLVVKVDDLRLGGSGVFFGQVDILHDRSKADLVTREVTLLSFTPEVSGGSFTLTFNGQTTAPINFSSTQSTMSNRIENALLALPNIDPFDVDVTVNYADVFSTRQYWVTYKGQFGGIDLPNDILTANTTGLTGTGAALNISTFADSNVANSNSVRESFRTYVIPDVVDELSYIANLSASLGTDRFNDVSAQASLGTPPGSDPVELVRARVRATDGGTLTFTLDRSSLGLSEVSLFNFNRPLLESEIAFNIPAVTLTVTEAATANPDVATVAEGNATGVVISPLGNDTVQTGTKQIPAFTSFTTVNGGLVERLNSTQIRYTNTTNFAGVDEFSYTLSNGLGATDTSTISVTVTGVNDAPVIGLPPAGQTTAEDTALLLTGANVISISDVDILPSATMVATLSSSQGTFSLTSVPGVSISGNLSGSVNISGTLSAINSALATLVFTPTSNFSGTATINVTANDGGSSGTGGALQTNSSFTVNVTAVNDGPGITALLSRTMFEDEVLLLGSPTPITVSDVDVGAGLMSITVTAPNGTLTADMPAGTGGARSGQGTSTLTLTGSLANLNAALLTLTYDPNNGFFSTETISLVVSDNGNTGTPGALTASADIVVNVQPTVRPRARDDVFSVAEGNTTQMDVLVNDEANIPDPTVYNRVLDSFDIDAMADINGTPTAVGTISRVEAGLAGSADDLLLYTPKAGFEDFFGTVVFSYTMTDDKPGSIPVTAIVTLTVTNVNDAPVAVDDSYFIDEDTTLIVPGSGNLDTLIANDEDVDGDNLSVTVTQLPTNGTLSWNPNGSFTYTPNSNYNGVDEFSYTVSDGVITSNVATVSIFIAAVNDAPVGVVDSYTTLEDTTLNVNGTIAFPSVLANDTDVENDPLTADLLTTTTRGTLTFNEADGTFTYVPTLNLNGPDSFTYRAFDGDKYSAPVTVTINVTPVNDAPTATTDNYVVEERATLTVAAPGVLGNDVDTVEGSPLTAQLQSSTSNGTLNFNANGSFTYTPNNGFLGTDSFTYRASDGTAFSAITTVNILVTDVNDPPTANPDSYTTAEDTALIVPGAGLLPTLLANDTDPESVNTSLTTLLVSGPTSGSLTLNGNGTFTYTPATNFNGTATFTYRVSDGVLFSPPTTVTITVTPVNDAPVVTNKSILAVKDIADQDFIIVTAADTDVENNNLTVVGLSTTNVVSASNSITTIAGGTVTISGTKGILYTPAAGYEGPDSFFYTVSDGTAQVVAQVNVSVVSFRTTDVTGRVYYDADKDGGLDPAESGIAGAKVRIVGTDFQGNSVSTGYVLTDENGYYLFEDVLPGSYHIEQLQPASLADGAETAGNGGALTLANDRIALSLPILGIIGGSNGHLFGEKGIDPLALTSPAGLYAEMLASSGSNGVVFEFDISGNTTWFYKMQGWSGLEEITFQLSADRASGILTVNGGSPTTIYQAPQTGSASAPRFRILGTTHSGNIMIRLDGTATGFGLNLAAAEGEPADPAMQQYEHAVDAAFGDESTWA